MQAIKDFCLEKLNEQHTSFPPKIGSRSSIRKASERYLESDIDEKFAQDNPEFRSEGFNQKDYQEFMRRLDQQRVWMTNEIHVSNSYSLFQQLLSKCKIEATLQQIKAFNEQLQNNLKKEQGSFDYQPFIMPEIDKMLAEEEKAQETDEKANENQNIPIEEFLKLVKMWFKYENPKLVQIDVQKMGPKTQSQPNFRSSNYSPPPFSGSSIGSQQVDFQTKLQQTIADYEALRSQKLQNNEDVSVIDSLLGTLKSQTKKTILSSRSKTEKTFEDKCRQGIKDIFSYYASQQKLLGKTPTFDAIQKNLEILNAGKFLKFCRDFGIMHKTRSADRKYLSQQTALKIFIKNSMLQKEMDENQFLQALEIMAQFFYDAEYDKINNTDIKSLAPFEKKLKFFEFIGSHDPAIYNQRLKGFSKAFGEGLSRIPEDDIGKKYKLNPHKIQQQKLIIDDWKRTKTNEKNRSSEKPKATKMSITPAPADAIYTQSNMVPKRESYKKYLPKGETVTWKGLGEMTANDIGKDEDLELENLIVDNSESGDEYLAKQYPLPKSKSYAGIELSRTTKKDNLMLPPVNDAPKQVKSLTNQTLQRAGELSEAARKSEGSILQRGLKLADARINKANQYAAKLRRN